MAITPVTFPDHGVLTVKTTGNDEQRTWSNSIDLVWTTGAGPPVYSNAIVTAFVTFLAGIQRSDCTITHVALRNWSRGDQPFSSQAAIWEQVVDVPCKNWGSGKCFAGEASDGTTPIGEIVALISKGNFTGGGRVSHLALRNVLPQEYLAADTGGPPVLATAVISNVPDDVNAWIAGNLSSYLEDAALPRFCNVHYSPSDPPPFDDPIGAMQWERVSTHNLSRKRRA
jgi:hypothetical protein